MSLHLKNKGCTVYTESLLFQILQQQQQKKSIQDYHFLFKLNKSFTGSAFHSQTKISSEFFYKNFNIQKYY